MKRVGTRTSIIFLLCEEPLYYYRLYTTIKMLFFLRFLWPTVRPFYNLKTNTTARVYVILVFNRHIKVSIAALDDNSGMES